MEGDILLKLGFDLIYVSPLQITSLLLNNTQYSHIESVKYNIINIFSNLIEKSLSVYQMTSFLPSVRGVAAIQVALSRAADIKITESTKMNVEYTN
jgi:hypothetical protein